MLIMLPLFFQAPVLLARRKGVWRREWASCSFLSFICLVFATLLQSQLEALVTHAPRTAAPPLELPDAVQRLTQHAVGDVQCMLASCSLQRAVCLL
jgi:hypothetical protein